MGFIDDLFSSADHISSDRRFVGIDNGYGETTFFDTKYNGEIDHITSTSSALEYEGFHRNLH